MPKQIRFKTSYPGVYYVETEAIGSNKPEKIYYIRYRRNGKMVEEKAGRQFQDDMTPARAAGKRARRIEGKQQTNTEKRGSAIKEKLAEQNKWTIDRIWNEYLQQKENLNKGLKQDKSRYNLYIQRAFGKKEPGELVQLDIDRMRIKLLKTKTPQTVKHILSLLRRIINFGTKKNLCEPLKFIIEMPSVDNEKTEDLTTEQLIKLHEVLDHEENVLAANYIRMILLTGMRRGELFKLQWTDIDFNRGFIYINDPKGGPSQKIPMNDAARQILESMERTSIYVFPGKNGELRTDFRKPINRIKKAAGLPKDFRPSHGCRHVYASMLASSGQVDMYTLQKLMTHKSPQMTQRYAHLRDDTLKRASDLAGDIINQTVNRKVDKKISRLKDIKE